MASHPEVTPGHRPTQQRQAEVTPTHSSQEANTARNKFDHSADVDPPPMHIK